MTPLAVQPLREGRGQPFDEGFEHETLLVRRGRHGGVPVIVAVHSTALGPALGGCRMWSYPTLADGVRDALRLSAAMTLKAAVAGLPLGGGKSVVCLPAGAERPRGAFREAILRDVAEAVEVLDGSYVTAEDVGTDSDDMAFLSGWTEHVVGRPKDAGGGGDPGAFTAAGVEAAIRACCTAVFGTRSLAGRRVAVVGVGSVGGALARRLKAGGAELVLADLDAGKEALAAALGARWMDAHDALRADVDVLAPCALGGVLDDELVGEVRCRVICGAANNQLADDGLAAELAARGVLYAPDFVVNAAGLINASLELTGYDLETAQLRAAGIEQKLAGVLEHARATGQTPLDAAVSLADRRLHAAAVAPAA
ncbi:MAG TPA: Glu/Leu/Phe/Val dehydrogenase dimerization domain-containing protein [Solirubrobacteraceae bacterium]|nr:Glu/Leu/Phe/Val dehydrogenase dimerization domain-containing protein [Solirubrobacteraceae bacterium]